MAFSSASPISVLRIDGIIVSPWRTVQITKAAVRSVRWSSRERRAGVGALAAAAAF